MTEDERTEAIGHYGERIIAQRLRQHGHVDWPNEHSESWRPVDLIFRYAGTGEAQAWQVKTYEGPATAGFGLLVREARSGDTTAELRHAIGRDYAGQVLVIIDLGFPSMQGAFRSQTPRYAPRIWHVPSRAPRFSHIYTGEPLVLVRDLDDWGPLEPHELALLRPYVTVKLDAKPRC